MTNVVPKVSVNVYFLMHFWYIWNFRSSNSKSQKLNISLVWNLFIVWQLFYSIIELTKSILVCPRISLSQVYTGSLFVYTPLDQAWEILRFFSSYFGPRVYPKGFLVITSVVRPSVCQSVFKYLRDRSLVFSETLHEVVNEVKKVTRPKFWKKS